MFLLVKLVAVAFTIALGSQLIGGIRVGGMGSALFAAVIYGLLYVVLGWLVSLVVGLLSIVPGILTFGLFFFLVPLLVHTVLLKMTAGLLSGFDIRTWGAAFLLSLLLGIVNLVLERIAYQSPA